MPLENPQQQASAVATVLIVEDEPVALRGLRKLLDTREDIRVVGECTNGLAAVNYIRREQPDLVVLDVRMPGLNGFEVLQQVGPGAMPLVVFVTAYDSFAIRAFEVAAVDYVVKPFTDERLMEAIDRSLARHAERVAAAALRRLVDSIEPQVRDVARSTSPGPHNRKSHSYWRERFLVGTGMRDAVIHASEIIRIRASGCYASLVTQDRKEYLVRTPLDQLERELDPSHFVRVHRSAIVSLREVRGVERTARRSAIVVLRDGTRVPLSRSRRVAVLMALGGSSGKETMAREGLAGSAFGDRSGRSE
jgi:two-component system LytT family response regulator